MSSFGQSYLAGLGPADGTAWRRLDLMERIIDQDPRATPAFEITGMSEAKSAYHQWQVRGVPDRATVAASDGSKLEGVALTGQEVDVPSRKFNYTEIFHTGVEVTRRSQAESHYGVSDIWQDQIDHFTYVHRTAIEYQLINGTVTVGTTDIPSVMNGMIASAANASAHGTAFFTETVLIDALETLWTKTDAPMVDFFSNSKIKRGVDKFASLGAVRNMEVRTRDVVHTVTKYFSSFGEVDMHLCRDMSNTIGESATAEFLLFDRRDLSKAYLDRTHLQPVAKTKDADTLVIISELTLNYGNDEKMLHAINLDVSVGG